MYHLGNNEFKNAYDKLCYFHDRLTVFSDFIRMCAISIYNSFANNEILESDYLKTINSYSKNEQELFVKMFGELILMYEKNNTIVDILGPLYMNMSSKDRNLGQVFTPEHIAKLMAKITITDVDLFKEKIKQNGYITIMDPTCGSGRSYISLC